MQCAILYPQCRTANSRGESVQYMTCWNYVTSTAITDCGKHDGYDPLCKQQSPLLNIDFITNNLIAVLSDIGINILLVPWDEQYFFKLLVASSCLSVPLSFSLIMAELSGCGCAWWNCIYRWLNSLVPMFNKDNTNEKGFVSTAHFPHKLNFQ
jgi:hypothetical protein